MVTPAWASLACSGAAKASLQLDRCRLRRWAASRRLRLLTVAYGTAQSVQQVYSSADSEAIVALMAHKLVAVAARMGNVHTRLVLRAWLQHLVAAHMRSLDTGKPPTPQEVWRHLRVLWPQAQRRPPGLMVACCCCCCCKSLGSLPRPADA